MRRFAVASCLLLNGVCGGQSAQIPAPPQAKPIAIIHATVHTVSGADIGSGVVLFDKGVIGAVGDAATVRLSADVELVDATGLHVYPGLVATCSTLGLVETLQVAATDDRQEHGRVHPEVRAAAAVNTDSDLIPVARAAGILTAMVCPEGGLLAGRPSLMRLDGWTWEAMAIEPELGLFVNWPLTEPITAWWMDQTEEQQWKQIREDREAIDKVFDLATAYVASRGANPTQTADVRFEAMRETLAGRKPVFISAADAGQIEQAVAWALRRKLKPVIVGGAEANRVAELLKTHDVPVIVGGVHRLPARRHDDYDAAFTLPKALHEAGIRFCIATGGEPAHERNLAHQAATAAAYGLPPEAALKSITLHAAEILGAGGSLGSIETGKAATLIIATGDILDLRTDVLAAYIDGRRIDLGNRQKRLNEKYREKYRQLGLMPADG
jgi:imidazolonepropionase-like amidohydrolase